MHDATMTLKSQKKIQSTIVDNRGRRVGDFLLENIEDGSHLSVVSAYFTIYAYGSLRNALDGIDRFRFLYGEPRSVGSLDPESSEGKSFFLKDDSIELRQILTQKPLALACANWIKSKVDIRTVKRSGFLHGKLYHVNSREKAVSLVGSSNFTRRGLGFGTAPNLELNIEVRSQEEQNLLVSWFDEIWDDETITEDVKVEVLAALERLGKHYTPQFVYYKTLFHVFEDSLKQHKEREGVFQDFHLYDTAIWKALYEFQKDGVISAINRLQRHNGCIIADSVGLGKTWTALAVIKFFELRNERVLVLCPKRLEENWVRYTASAMSINNPFSNDRLNYVVRAHTDLSRYTGLAGRVDLASFNWGAFDLVVIDESHNFRNEGQDQRNEDGNIVRRSRYNRLLEEVIKSGARTKVLMLSATPVNTSLRDLRNQFYLITEKQLDTFQDSLGIRNIQTVFAVAQREFQNWERSRIAGKSKSKNELLENLGSDFLILLDAITIARSRDHIRRFYPSVAKKIGGFPHRTKPENLNPPTDSAGVFSYDNLHQQIGKFRLALYMPSRYLKDQSILEEEKEKKRFDQRDREFYLIGMLRVNLLKRLESSIHSFTLTMERIIGKIDSLEQQIAAWRKNDAQGQFDFRPEEDVDDEEFVVGRTRQYFFDEIDIGRWQRDMREDRLMLENVYNRAKQVTVDRDAKLAALKTILKRKADNALVDKDNRPNRKALVFTTFADTASYLYEQLASWAQTELNVHLALVTGGGNRSTIGKSGFNEILSRFAPYAQQFNETHETIDFVIATDCLSEGQNLQDCDYVINYDIHWNPVRLMQRFGRIDRLGSRNKQVYMTNFWPTVDLDRYLDLKNRVEARMALVDASATGVDDPFDQRTSSRGDTSASMKLELSFRDTQLTRMREEILDLEDAEDGVTLNELTLDDFFADLLSYVQKNRAALEEAPLGIYAVVHDKAQTLSSPNSPMKKAQPGVIFCLKRSTDTKTRSPNRFWPYFIVYIQDDGTVRYGFRQSQHCLTLFKLLAGEHASVMETLEDLFDYETEHGQNMEKYNGLLMSTLRNIDKTFNNAELTRLTQYASASLTKKTESENFTENFTLVTWLVILDKDRKISSNVSNNDG